VKPRWRLVQGSRSLKVASNDGYLLHYLVERGIPCLGVSIRLANCAKAGWTLRLVQTEVAFFGSKVGAQLRERDGTADYHRATMWLAHYSRTINDFRPRGSISPARWCQGVRLSSFRMCLEMIRTPSSSITIYQLPLLLFCRFWRSSRLFERHGLRVTDVERLSNAWLGHFGLYVAHAGAISGVISVQHLATGDFKRGSIGLRPLGFLDAASAVN